jgi:hypothetical protein
MKRGRADHFGNVAVLWRIVLSECAARMWSEFMFLWMGFGDRVVNTVMIYRFP